VIIRTISGDKLPSEIGRVNYHEHAFQTSPLLVGEELNDLDKSAREFVRLRDSGFESYVDATPIGLGRNLNDIVELQKRTNLNIIHTTGVHRQAHYKNADPLLRLTATELANIFQDEIQIGMNFENSKRSNVRAGLVKFGVGANEISKFESEALQAVASVSNTLGVAVMVHLESAVMAHKVLDELQRFGCDLRKVALAHIDRTPERTLHSELASRGAFLGYDGAGRTKYFPDSVLVELFKSITEAGFSAKVLLGTDVARSSRYIEYGGSPGLEYLGKKFIPEIRTATSEDNVNQVITKNPQNWLAFTPGPS
jgi:predicted metal-dependent phosphotriesterase family hydrolase